ncbi:unnamed protein product [Linum tenue]|uniref:Uncharacterized protein n=1 Tax=Linum tenue TaxID=586396 RepID=A0AAV0KIZ9_9ROSI|nr:unnamed protein product [Linum tenue]
MFLPLKYAGKTCALSRKWRHVWTRVPQLVFDSNFGAVDPQLTDPSFYMSRIFEVPTST